MIRNIIFDMGNVLIHFRPEVYVGRLGVTEEEAHQLLRQVFRSVEWVQMDHGLIDEEEAVRRVCRRLPGHLHEDVRRLVFEWDEPIMPVEGMYELTEELKQAGYGIYLLSNASVRHPRYWPKIPASRFFDGLVVSAEEGIMEPREEIYLLLCSRFGLDPGECFFIDDLPANVETARYVGMDGMVFGGSAAEARQELHRAGVRIQEKV